MQGTETAPTHQTAAERHGFEAGDRVTHRQVPALRGTVIGYEGDLTVVEWDSEPGRSRYRYGYGLEAASR
jgi:hypothetical protein